MTWSPLPLLLLPVTTSLCSYTDPYTKSPLSSHRGCQRSRFGKGWCGATLPAKVFQELFSRAEQELIMAVVYMMHVSKEPENPSLLLPYCYLGHSTCFLQGNVPVDLFDMTVWHMIYRTFSYVFIQQLPLWVPDQDSILCPTKEKILNINTAHPTLSHSLSKQQKLSSTCDSRIRP